MRLPVVLLLLASLSGCGTWVNTGDPAANFGAQLRQCEEQAYVKHPPRYGWVQPFPGYGYPWAPTCFRTAAGLACPTFPFWREWPVAEDINASFRRMETRECLRGHGWSFEPNSQAGTPASPAKPSQEPAAASTPK